MINIGVDLHKTQFTTCVRSKDGNSYSQYPTTSDGYTSFLSNVSAWQSDGRQVRVGVESTGNTRYFKQRLEEYGVEVVTINTLKFKVVNESVKKTDKHDAATIVEFLEKDMLPESRLCSQQSEQLRRLLKVRTTLVRSIVVVKNQIHALLVGLGMEDKKASLQSRRGRQRVLASLSEVGIELVVQPLFDTIESLEFNVKHIEDELEKITELDNMVKLLQTIPGCGKISAWTIRAYTDDINRFATAKKYVSYAGMAPWVQNSNESVRYGKITKRGPMELRTAIVQVVMGIRRYHKTTGEWRLMKQYEYLKQHKGSGKSIIATGRKVATIIWHMLSKDETFNIELMYDKKLRQTAEQLKTAV